MTPLTWCTAVLQHIRRYLDPNWTQRFPTGDSSGLHLVNLDIALFDFSSLDSSDDILVL